MAGCKIDDEACPQFKILRDHWNKRGHPSVVSDLEDAFKELRKDVQACHRKVAERTSAIVKEAVPDANWFLHKYRYRDRAAREGARGGWRFYAIFDADRNVLYPIIVYPHKEWSDANDDLIKQTVNELITVLRQREINSN